jgi:hypothetical protein
LVTKRKSRLPHGGSGTDFALQHDS